MSNMKKKVALADRINEALKPQDLFEEETECNAEIEDFDEHQKNNHKTLPMSDFRKRNARQLYGMDKKYSGSVASRKDFDQQEYGSSDSDNMTETHSEEATDSEQSNGSTSSEDESENDEYFDSSISNFASINSNDKAAVSMKIMDSKRIDEEVKKGQSIQNQQKIWENLLEARIKAQKMLTTANAMPDYDSHIELLEVHSEAFSNKVEQSLSNIYNLLDNLVELQSTLVKNFTDTKNLKLKRKSKSKPSNMFTKRSKLAEYDDLISKNNELYNEFRNTTLQKWHERTKTVKEMKGSTGNIDFMTKIQNALLKKDEMIRKTQLFRGGYNLFGRDTFNNGELYSAEIFDDSEFYHQQLRELIEYKSGLDENQFEIAQKLIELQRVRGKMQKRVDTRASKGRKIRYIVHNKLVNFMAPNDECTMSDEAKVELFNSLFGAANEGEMV